MKFLYSLMLFLCLSINIYAQKANVATGGNATGSGGTISYSIGQINYTNTTGSGGSAMQGVQHPYEIFAITGIEDIKVFCIELSTFPNPTFDFLTLKIESSTSKNLVCQLLDMNGKLLATQKIEGVETKISMSNYASASYFLKVTEEDNTIKTFKIIKY